MTGADSPVIADSSTVAMPSIDLAVAGDHLAGRDDAQVADLELVRALLETPPSAGAPRATVSERVLRSVSACALPASLGHGLGEVGEQHREPQPAVDRARRRRSPTAVDDASSRTKRNVVKTLPDLDRRTSPGCAIVWRGSSLMNAVARLRPPHDRRVEQRSLRARADRVVLCGARPTGGADSCESVLIRKLPTATAARRWGRAQGRGSTSSRRR